MGIVNFAVDENLTMYPYFIANAESAAYRTLRVLM
jgi:hypothetical protein